MEEHIRSWLTFPRQIPPWLVKM